MMEKVYRDIYSEDDLFTLAVDLILESHNATASMLQRKMKLNYSRAARLINQIEQCGYIGTMNGANQRQIYLTLERWNEIKELNGE